MYLQNFMILAHINYISNGRPYKNDYLFIYFSFLFLFMCFHFVINFICLFIYSVIYFICLFILFAYFCLFICFFICLFIYFYFYLFIYLFYMFTYLLIYVSDYQLESACKHAPFVAPSRVTQKMFDVLVAWSRRPYTEFHIYARATLKFNVARA